MRGIGDASKALARAAGAMELPIGDLERRRRCLLVGSLFGGEGALCGGEDRLASGRAEVEISRQLGTYSCH